MVESLTPALVLQKQQGNKSDVKGELDREDEMGHCWPGEEDDVNPNVFKVKCLQTFVNELVLTQ